MNDAKASIDSIFHAALEKSTPEERAAYLDEACGNDTGLRRRVERLLAAHPKAADLMERSAADLEATIEMSRVTEQPGSIIGPYKLLQQIGEGGFGVVFMAEQREPVRRKVALKVIKPGMDTKEVIARFEAEEQALAMMSHPNIAHVIDAGVTDSGRPYFAMELVRGIPITAYCDQNTLGVNERLRLLVSVCRAIQHAHQKGIIHRDIKPTNVLVTLQDGEPLAKVIDFGVAKAIDQQLTERTLFTRFAEMIGTPMYMSPEQAGLDALDIDTRSDIYSLGVLLYELLTGTTPFERVRFRRAAAEEIRRIIREEDPPTPSRRLAAGGDKLKAVARQRNVPAESLVKSVRRDLDWVVMKCLDKNRGRRYETASGLADDVERFLRNEPVEAYPPSRTYKLAKFLKRNRVALLVVGALIASLLLGLVGTSLGWKRAHDVESVLRAEKERVNIARDEAIAARNAAAAERAKAIASKETALKQRNTSNRLLARKHLERGVELLNQGNRLGLFDVLDARIATEELQEPGLREVTGRLWAIAHECWADRLVHVLPEADSLAFSPDGRLFATGKHKSMQMWNLKTGEAHGPLLQIEKDVSVVLFSPDGKLLAAYSAEGAGRLWNTSNGEAVGPVLRHEGDIDGDFQGFPSPNELPWVAKFSPDGTLLATASLDGSVRLWETENGRLRAEPIRHRSMVFSVAFSADGKLLATCSGDKTARIWDIVNGKPHGSPMKCGGAKESQVAFSPNGRFLFVKSATSLNIWDYETGQRHKGLRTPWSFHMDLSPDGRFLAAACVDGSVRLWDTWNDTVDTPQVAIQHDHRATVVRFSPDGALLASGGHDKTVRLCNAATGDRFGSTICFPEKVRCIEFSSDGRFLAMSGGTTQVWRIQPDREPVVQCEKDALDGVFSPDGSIRAVKTQGGVQFLDVTTGKPLGKELSLENCLVMSFSADNELVAWGRMDWKAYVWEIRTGRLLRTYKCSDWVTRVSLSPKGELLATSDRHGIVQLFDVGAGDAHGLEFQHPTKWVDGMAFSRDSCFLVTVSREGDQNFGNEKHKEGNLWVWAVSIGDPYLGLALPYQVTEPSRTLRSFSQTNTVVDVCTREGSRREWSLPEAPSDMEEMKLRTQIALGMEQGQNGRLIPISVEKWRELQRKLRRYMRKEGFSNSPHVP